VNKPLQKGSALPVGKYVVYDPPADDLPYVAVLFLPEQRPRAFLFGSAEEAETFLTSSAVEIADAESPPRPARKRIAPAAPGH
jgi:hypothetical protein